MGASTSQGDSLMKKALRAKPSASMVVSMIALVVALSGTAVAATKMVNGDSLIEKNSLSGNRLVNHTITGQQVNLSKLGTVPKATHATSATTATNATNATKLGGQPASAYIPASEATRSGFIQANAGQTVPVVRFGPFKLQLDCVNDGPSGDEGELLLTSSVANAEFEDTPLVKGTPTEISFESASTSFDETTLGANDVADATGDAYNLVYNAGENFPGASGNCFAWATAQKS
jgi:hypothetical protein